MVMTTPKNTKNKRTCTILYDDFPKELDGSTVWVYSAINRHCMMRKRFCDAKQETLARESRVSLSTEKRCMQKPEHGAQLNRSKAHT
jgi:hypothetical protein